MVSTSEKVKIEKIPKNWEKKKMNINYRNNQQDFSENCSIKKMKTDDHNESNNTSHETMQKIANTCQLI